MPDLTGFSSVARTRSLLLVGVLWISIITITSTTETCVCLQNVISRLYNPVHVEFLPNTIYIAEQRGIVRYFGSRDKDGSTFLNITNKAYMTTNPADEQGLLGFTFHPRYNENFKVYVYYISNSTGTHHALVSEFTRGKDGAETTEKVLLKVEQISSRGNGGAVGNK
jgi:glucose/arabinose dehydrogenase